MPVDHEKFRAVKGYFRAKIHVNYDKRMGYRLRLQVLPGQERRRITSSVER